MSKTLIETSTKARFATKFMVLEDHRPTEENVLVFKDSEDSSTFLVLRYTRDLEGRIVQRGTLEEVPEEEFKREHAPHAKWDNTSLREHDSKWQDWRSSSLKEKLEQLKDE
jgi:ATP-dependent helicase YprA (DUF1998 family)